MKKLAIISFTEHGSRMNAMLEQALSLQGYDCSCTAVEKYAGKWNLEPLKVPLKEWTGEMFETMDGILFIGAAGIAVRSIAPFVQDKTKDPAVTVMDEKGVFAISLLSGHLGGANELAAVLANLTGAIPVITTATDVNGRFAVDVFAKKNQLYITDMKKAKAISADVLDEKKIGFYCDYPVIGQIPEELEPWSADQVFEGTNGICISTEDKQFFKETLQLIPKIWVIGIGCKKNTPFPVIEKRVLETLKEGKIPMESVAALASIDIKAEEPGILELSEKYGIPFITYTAEELAGAKGCFSESAFVASVTGVSNVCERSAYLASDGGSLILGKSVGEGVTTAAAVKEFSIDFS